MTHYIPVWALVFLSVAITSCDRDEDEEAPDTLSLLNSSTWVGPIETERIEYDEANNVTNQTTEAIPDGEYRQITLNDDRTALVKYLCDKANCTGDVYDGKWTFADNILHVTLNREQFNVNSLADWLFIEAEIFRINSEQLILERTFYVGTAPNVVKNINRYKYIRVQ